MQALVDDAHGAADGAALGLDAGRRASRRGPARSRRASRRTASPPAGAARRRRRRSRRRPGGRRWRGIAWRLRSRAWAAGCEHRWCRLLRWACASNIGRAAVHDLSRANAALRQRPAGCAGRLRRVNRVSRVVVACSTRRSAASRRCSGRSAGQRRCRARVYWARRRFSVCARRSSRRSCWSWLRSMLVAQAVGARGRGAVDAEQRVGQRAEAAREAVVGWHR